jgi:NCAIR mutase (PurE)-related protein
VAVICAGTSDLPVAEEAAVTLEIFGNHVERISDVGVAGIHRLLAVRDKVEACSVIIVVAGMEGALPSAVAGLVSKPVIAVPTSVGYGASFGGLAALLGMLNSCGSGGHGGEYRQWVWCGLRSRADQSSGARSNGRLRRFVGCNPD